MDRGNALADRLSIVLRTSPVPVPGCRAPVIVAAGNMLYRVLVTGRGATDLGDRPQRHHVAVGVADLELPDGLRIRVVQLRSPETQCGRSRASVLFAPKR
jgi:hypothetical protein